MMSNLVVYLLLAMLILYITLLNETLVCNVTNNTVTVQIHKHQNIYLSSFLSKYESLCKLT